ncbi:MAG TPA: MFS transporter [Steroidobacteraceae bacterium]|jgi:MFS family permease|nr:MFS transporter [Steroidobacteraceae bacterium]
MGTLRSSSPFSNHDFRLLFGGSSISMVGDQFTLIALPWLVLQLTGNPVQLGLVLAAMALPRAVFMLVGGAVVDRLSPRRVLLTARGANALLAGLLAALVLAGTIQMWMVYVLAFSIGLCTAFAYPAGGSILPQIVESAQLQMANSMIMGMRQLSLLIGPALAGLLVTAGSSGKGSGVHGTGLAFAVDAVSFLFSVASLLAIRIASDRDSRAPAGGVFAQVWEGFRALSRDLQLRSFVAYMALVSVLVMGPLQVGLPLFAKARFSEGAAAFGWLMTANGVGMLLGSVMSTSVTRLLRGRLGVMILSLDAAAGLALAALSGVHSVLAGAALLVLTGLFAGTVQIAIITWLQRRVPQAMMGRIMSIVFFTFLGLAPLAAALAGGLLKLISLNELFVGAGLSLTTVALLCLTRPSLRAIQLQRAPA